MSLPKKKRGFRRIVVDGVAYDWRCDKRIDIRRADRLRSSLIIDIDVDPWLLDANQQLKVHPITPAFVANAIQELKQLGWAPETHQSQIATYEDGVFSLKAEDTNS